MIVRPSLMPSPCARPRSRCQHSGWTALAAAAYQKKMDIVSLLLDRGADVNMVDGKYGTALAAAAFAGEIVLETQWVVPFGRCMLIKQLCAPTGYEL